MIADVYANLAVITADSIIRISCDFTVFTYLLHVFYEIKTFGDLVFYIFGIFFFTPMTLDKGLFSGNVIYQIHTFHVYSFCFI